MRRLSSGGFIARSLAWILLLAFPPVTVAAVERIVVIKADGLPFELVDQLVQRQNLYTGKSLLPWIAHVFYENGSRVSNFYSRGLSLSAPSWAMLDTGRHSLIKGNVEYDRFTLDAYDYLNMFSLVLKNPVGRPTDTPIANVLDEHGVSMISDLYEPQERHLSLQLTGRGVKPLSLAGGLKRLLTLQNPRDWLDEWTMGFQTTDVLFEVLERDLIAKLRNPDLHYLDFLIPSFDHAAHLTREPEAQLRALQHIDGVVQRIWTAVQNSPFAATTVLVLVSDHGMNTDPEVYSQGFNLIQLFNSAEGGGHHVLTNRPPLANYRFKSLSPTIPLIVSPSPESFYLKGQSSDYPTLALDTDGNERASVYLRQSDLNTLQILWQQLLRKDLSEEVRKAAIWEFFATLDRNRFRWTTLVENLGAEFAALNRSNQSQPGDLAYIPYLRSLNKLLELRPETFDPSRARIEEFISARSLGGSNSLYDLQNYVVGPGREGLVLSADGSLDKIRSFARVNYFSLLEGIRVRNNVQASVAPTPVDFLAFHISGEPLKNALPEHLRSAESAIWLSADDDRQALVLVRHTQAGKAELRYTPIRRLTQGGDGTLRFDLGDWREGLPLKIWESLALSPDLRLKWLESWRAERDWFEAFHGSAYSNAVVSLYEQFAAPDGPATVPAPDGPLIARFRERKRAMAQADFIVFANDHWNFNFRDFNPGGNHGAFFRNSTHATLMFAGGESTGIPRGLQIDRPYDVLSYAPTIMSLSGRVDSKMLSTLPGPIINELFDFRALTKRLR